MVGGSGGVDLNEKRREGVLFVYSYIVDMSTFRSVVAVWSFETHETDN